MSSDHSLEPRRASPAVAYAASLAMVAAATGLGLAVEQHVSVPNLSLVFVLPVVVAAAAFGWGPAITAALAGVAAYNFFLIPPLRTFVVADPSNVWALVFLLGAGAVVSFVAAQARRRAVDAAWSARQARALEGLAKRLVSAADGQTAAAACADALSALFDAPAVVFLDADGQLDAGTLAGGAAPGEADRDAAAWALASRLATRGGAYPAGEAVFDFWPVVSGRRQAAVLGVAISGGERGRPDHPEGLVEAVGAYLAVALDREALLAEVTDARVAAAGEQLKADLLAAVSHDLKTPLATILVSLQSLQAFGTAHSPETQAELLTLAEAETGRLARLVDDLLDTGRLEAGGVVADLRAEAAGDLIAAAVAQAGPALAGRRVDTEAGPGPAMRVDRGLFGSALAKVSRTPPGTAPRARPCASAPAARAIRRGSRWRTRGRDSTRRWRRCSAGSCAAWPGTDVRPVWAWACPSRGAS
ncbi:MAG: DUF4118 domain-containing protein [Phenylobacterium sp.]|nr:DUF4118 domain-containing protein [Phenylobacterium sp.]